MNIAVFADIHGRVLLAFKLCARWEHETGEKLDLILQAGDLGAFPYADALDRATRSHTEADPSELGFMNDFGAHDCAPDAMAQGSGSDDIGWLLRETQPSYHFFGHYGGPSMTRTEHNGATFVCKLADLH